jgi:hypothetical protein
MSRKIEHASWCPILYPIHRTVSGFEVRVEWIRRCDCGAVAREHRRLIEGRKKRRADA